MTNVKQLDGLKMILVFYNVLSVADLDYWKKKSAEEKDFKWLVSAK